MATGFDPVLRSWIFDYRARGVDQATNLSGEIGDRPASTGDNRFFLTHERGRFGHQVRG